MDAFQSKRIIAKSRSFRIGPYTTWRESHDGRPHLKEILTATRNEKELPLPLFGMRIMKLQMHHSIAGPRLETIQIPIYAFNTIGKRNSLVVRSR